MKVSENFSMKNSKKVLHKKSYAKSHSKFHTAFYSVDSKQSSPKFYKVSSIGKVLPIGEFPLAGKFDAVERVIKPLSY